VRARARARVCVCVCVCVCVRACKIKINLNIYYKIIITFLKNFNKIQIKIILCSYYINSFIIYTYKIFLNSYLI